MHLCCQRLHTFTAMLIFMFVGLSSFKFQFAVFNKHQKIMSGLIWNKSRLIVINAFFKLHKRRIHFTRNKFFGNFQRCRIYRYHYQQRRVRYIDMYNYTLLICVSSETKKIQTITKTTH